MEVTIEVFASLFSSSKSDISEREELVNRCKMVVQTRDGDKARNQVGVMELPQ